MRRFPTTTRSATLFPPKLEAWDFAETKRPCDGPAARDEDPTILEIKV
jgi:hypothetical protein